MSIPRPTDPEKREKRIRRLREWQQRSVKTYQETVKEEALAGERESKLDRSTRINPVNRERKAKRFRKAYGSKERMKLIKSLPCTVPHCQRKPSENAHTETGGAGMKAGWETNAPLCGYHHRTATDSLHNLGSVERFDATHGTDLRATAQRLAEEYPAQEAA